MPTADEPTLLCACRARKPKDRREGGEPVDPRGLVEAERPGSPVGEVTDGRDVDEEQTRSSRQLVALFVPVAWLSVLLEKNESALREHPARQSPHQLGNRAVRLQQDHGSILVGHPATIPSVLARHAQEESARPGGHPPERDRVGCRVRPQPGDHADHGEPTALVGSRSSRRRLFFIFFCNIFEIIPFFQFPASARMAVP